MVFLQAGLDPWSVLRSGVTLLIHPRIRGGSSGLSQEVADVSISTMAQDIPAPTGPPEGTPGGPPPFPAAPPGLQEISVRQSLFADLM